jgi:hypothetical protein
VAARCGDREAGGEEAARRRGGEETRRQGGEQASRRDGEMARWRGMEAEGEWAGRHGQARSWRELIEDGRGSNGLLILTRGLSPFHIFFHFPAKKSVQTGRWDRILAQVYLFQRSFVPPRSPLHYQLENGGATI